MGSGTLIDERQEPVLRTDDSREFRMAWEILGLASLFFGAFLAISLIVGPGGQSLIGPVGSMAAGILRFLFGIFVSFAVPGFVVWFGIKIFLGRRTGWAPARTLGIIMVLLAATGAIALPYADNPELREISFQRAGALGTFMVEWEGLRLVGSLGTIGAAMVLGVLAVTGTVMMTRISLSQMASMLHARVSGQPMPEKFDAEAHTPIPTTPDVTAPSMRAARPAPTSEDEIPVPVEPAPKPLLGTLFGRDKRAEILSEPLPEEVEDLPLFDEDSLAAARALEEARIDEEFERALRSEQSSGLIVTPSMEPVALPADLLEELEAEERSIATGRSREIVIHDSLDSVPLMRSGNPAEKRESAPATSTPPVPTLDDLFAAPMAPAPAGPKADLGKGLAKLFPTRWPKEDEDEEKPEPVAERIINAALTPAEILDRAEERAMRNASKVTTPVGDEEDDPLFDASLDTRPAGPLAAREAAKVSAVEEDDSVTHRNRMLAEYRLPGIELLADPPKVDNRMTREEIVEMSATLEKTFADFGIVVSVTEVKQGPVVTRFELKPDAGVKVSRIVSLEQDIAMAMRAVSVRIVAPIPGKAAVGIEIPNRNRAGVYLKELVGTEEFWHHPSPLAFALGKTIDGVPYFADLKTMPHLLIAGATGAGKSVCLNTIICSFLYRQRPDRLRLLMVDPKRVELSIYQNIPHLISPVVCDAKRAAAALAWAVEQMEERYKKLVEFNVRNIDGYNDIVLNPEKQARHRGKNMEPMPHMVIVVDELADLMVVAKNEVEESIQRLAQMARAVGIHLILATQRPSVDVLTGIIKANFPTRIAFQVRQKVDSRTILDLNGAETLLGRGDMLFAPAGAGKPNRIQGAFLSDEEVGRIVDHCRELAEPMFEVEEFEPLLSDKEKKELAKLMGAPTSMEDLDMQEAFSRGTNKTMGKVTAGMFVPHDGGSANAGDEEIDEALVRAAARLVLEARKGSTSLVQRRLKVGFARAGRLMDMLQEMGIVGPYKGSKPRDLMVDPDAALAQLDMLETQIAQTGSSKSAAAALDAGVEEFVDDEDDADEEDQ